MTVSLLTVINQWLYDIGCLLLKKRLILLCCSAQSDAYANLPCVREALKAFPDVPCVCLQSGRGLRAALHFLFCLARARVVLMDAGNRHISRLRLDRRTQCVQCWHAGGAYKKMGFAAPRPDHAPGAEERRIARVHRNIRWFIVSDPSLAALYARAFRMDAARVLPLGVPRTDLLFGRDHAADKVELARLFPGSSGKTVLLYAPTFRTVRGKRQFPETLDFAALRAACAQSRAGGICLAFRRHPSLPWFPAPEGWLDFSGLPQDFCLSVSDILLTDYSSILFDFAVYRRPILLLTGDADDYETGERGFHHRPEAFSPQGVCRSTEDVAEKLLAPGGPEGDCGQSVWSSFMSACDGRAARRVAVFAHRLYHQESIA